MKIRRLTCLDLKKIQSLVSYLCNDENDKLCGSVFYEPLKILNSFLPLFLKFKPESFIIEENKEILGLITVSKTIGNPYKIYITRLLLKENQYIAGKKLVKFVIKKFGNIGAKSFSVVIDECHDELCNLFINGCGFRQCSSETLWKIKNFVAQKSNFRLRYAQDSDAKKISELYNSEIINIYQTSLNRSDKEFREVLFSGFSDYYKTRFVIEESNKILGYLSITTSDNLNYVFDITTNSGYDFNYDEIINAMFCEVARKKRAFFPLIKQKKYTKNSEKFENYLKSKNYTPIQTSYILTKDYYKPIKQECQNNIFIGENSVSGEFGL